MQFHYLIVFACCTLYIDVIPGYQVCTLHYFKVVTDSSRLPPIQAPARLEKLEKRKKKKKKVTEADIVAKLEKAEARRKVNCLRYYIYE